MTTLSDIETPAAVSTVGARWRVALTAAAICLVVLALDYRALHEPATSDVALFSIVARIESGETIHPSINLREGRGIWHPMLYQGLLNTVAATAGSHLIYARAAGLVCGLATALAAAWLGSLLLPQGRRAPWIGVLIAAIYMTNPFGRIGMLHIDIDNTVLPPLLLAAVGAMIVAVRRANAGTTAAALAWQAAAFGAKTTTPLLLPVAIGVRIALERRWREALRMSLLMLVGGAALFWTGWSLYCAVKGYPPTAVFQHVGRALGRHAALAGVPTFARHAMGVLYWLGPAFLLLSLLATVRAVTSWKRDPLSRDVALVAGIAWTILIVYIFIGGLAFSVPKYQYPAIPLLAVVIVVVAAREFSVASIPAWAGAMLAAAVVYYASIGDPLYDYLYRTRAILWEQNLEAGFPRAAVPMLLIDAGLVFAPLLIGWLAVRRLASAAQRPAATWLMLAIVMFGYNVGVGLTQARADYVTTYTYGARDLQTIIDRFQDGLVGLLNSEGALLGPWNEKRARFAPVRFQNPEQLVETLDRLRPDALIAGLPLNTLDQLAALRTDGAVRAILAERFREERLGDYLLYWRKAAARP